MSRSLCHYRIQRSFTTDVWSAVCQHRFGLRRSPLFPGVDGFIGHLGRMQESHGFDSRLAVHPSESVIHDAERRAALAEQPGHPVELIESKGFSCTG